MSHELPSTPKKRLIAVGLVWNRDGELLFCMVAPERGMNL